MSARHGELEHVTIPLISIDQYASKSGSDEEVVVVALFFREEMAAYDVDDFVDKGVIDVIDCEVGPNPDMNGHWVVFIEMRRIPSFWREFMDLVKDIENLTTELDWRVQVYGQDCLYDLKDPELRYQVPLTEEDYLMLREEVDATEYLEDSMLADVQIQESQILFKDANSALRLQLVDFGPASRLIHEGVLKEAKWNPISTSPRARVLNSMLGQGWSVETLEEYIIVTKNNDKRIMVLK